MEDLCDCLVRCTKSGDPSSRRWMRLALRTSTAESLSSSMSLDSHVSALQSPSTVLWLKAGLDVLRHSRVQHCRESSAEPGENAPSPKEDYVGRNIGRKGRESFAKDGVGGVGSWDENSKRHRQVLASIFNCGSCETFEHPFQKIPTTSSDYMVR